MVAYNRTSLIRHLPLGGAVAIGSVAAIAFLAMPADMLEALVARSGIAALVPVAQPPLGITARAVLALGSGVLGAAVTWAALYLVFGPGGFLAPAARADGVPVVRRADAHPDAPPRRPLSAADLGLPMMEPAAAPVAERAIPADLDLPLAAFDPHALLPVPMEPARAVAPLAVSVERAEPVEAPVRLAASDTALPSLETLLRRLERGAGRRIHAAAR